MASPQNNPKWAEGAIAEDLSFPSVEQVSGYKEGEDYPHQQINQYRRDLARWVIQGFATLADFITIAEDGEIGSVNSFDPTKSFGEDLLTTVALDAQCHAIDTDGRYVFTLEGDPTAPSRLIRVYDRETLTLVASATPINGADTVNELVALVCNGSHVAIAINDSGGGPVTGHVELYSWDPVTLVLTLEWIWTDTASPVPIRDIAIDDSKVYIAAQTSANDSNSGWAVEFSAGTGGANLTNGAELWSSAHTSNLSAVDSNGFYVVFGGEFDGAATWRVTNFQGSAIDNGGSGVADEIDERQIVVKDDRWYRVKNNGGVREYWVRGFIDGLAEEEFQLTLEGGAASPVNLQVDDRYMLTSVNTGDISVVDLRTGVILFRATKVTTVHGVAVDGESFFYCGEAAGGQIRRIYRGGGNRTWRRVVATDQNLPLRQLAIPEGN